MPQDPLEEIFPKHLAFDKHFELEVTPPKLHKEEKPTRLQEETSLPTKVARGVVIEDLPERVTSQGCP